MDTKELLVKIREAVSITLTPEYVSTLKDDGMIQTIKIVSDIFIGKNISTRLEMTLKCIRDFDPSLLLKFDITFVLVSKSENINWIDFEEENRDIKSGTGEFAAKEI